MATLKQWNEWRSRCALALCHEETQGALRAFGWRRFRQFTAAYAHWANLAQPAAATPSPRDAWHCFETYLRLRNTRQGKTYKHWLFARPTADGAPSLDSVQGGATLLMRDVVRECLRREFADARTDSLDAPLARDDDEPVPMLHDFLPGEIDTSQEVERREMEAIADAEAAGALASLDRRERIALLARELGLALSHAAVIRTADCAKSSLASAYHGALQGLANYVRSKYPREDNLALATLTTLVFGHVRHRILLWGKLENDCAGFFSLVEHER